jgi:hypothetical protein
MTFQFKNEFSDALKPPVNYQPSFIKKVGEKISDVFTRRCCEADPSLMSVFAT